ncbi:T9SS type A sorting domain-containing protein [candidate division KSB1 bacterium]|nr:T9SS type A sorting domain-containing protein [candidate division KSB1 bacterium]
MLHNYPNPFNASTTIRFELARSQNIRLRIYNMNGTLAQQLYQGTLNAGAHAMSWDADAHATGVYLVVLNGESGLKRVCKLLLVK